MDAKGTRYLLIAALAILVVALVIQVAYAYVAVTSNSGNKVVTEPMTVIVSSDPNDPTQLMEVSLPMPNMTNITSETENGPWSFNDPGVKRVSGYIFAQSPTYEGKMRVWIDMEDIRSWSVINRVTLNVYDDDLSKGSVTFKCADSEKKILVIKVKADAANTTYTLTADQMAVNPGYTITGFVVGSYTTTINTSYNASTQAISFQCSDNSNEYLLEVEVKASGGTTSSTSLTLSAGVGYTITGVITTSPTTVTDPVHSSAVHVSARNTKVVHQYTLFGADSELLEVGGEPNRLELPIKINDREEKNWNGKRFDIDVEYRDEININPTVISNLLVSRVCFVADKTEPLPSLNVRYYLGYYDETAKEVKDYNEKNNLIGLTYAYPGNVINAPVAPKGYAITGWYMQQDNKTGQGKGERWVFSENHLDPREGKYPDSDWKIINNIETLTLYAQYEVISYDITFDWDGLAVEGISDRKYDVLMTEDINISSRTSGNPRMNVPCTYYTSFNTGTISFKCIDNTNDYSIIIKVRADAIDTDLTLSASTGSSITGLISYTTEYANFSNGTVTFRCAEISEEYQLTIKVKANVEDTTYTISSQDGYAITGFVKGSAVTYNLKGWTGTGLSGIQEDITISKGSIGDRSYTAIWTYDITFDKNDKNDNSGTTSKQTIQKGVITSLNKTEWKEKGNQDFYGWGETDTSETRLYSDGQDVEDVGNKRLFVVWKDKCKVVYDANGTGETPPDSKTGIVYGSTIILEDGTWASQTVVIGWSTVSTGTGTFYELGGSMVVEGTVKQDGVYVITLYAIPGDVTVKFNRNWVGDDTTDETQIMNKKISVPLNLNTFEAPSGKTFYKWDTERDGAGDYEDGQSCIFASNTTLYAIWKPAITYNANGGSGTMDKQFCIGSVTLKENEFTKSGYSFANWNTSPDGTGTQYADQQSVSVENNLVLYAIWKHKVTYDGNGSTGGTVPMDNQSYNDGETVTVKGNTGSLERPNHAFAGWNTAADDSGKAYYVDDTFTILRDTKLYAMWGHTITFYSNEEVESQYTQIVRCDTPTALIPNEFTKSDCTFYGWNTNREGTGTYYADGYTVSLSADLQLYAIWGHSITFDLGVCPSGFEAPDTQAVLDGKKATKPYMELDAYRVIWYEDFVLSSGSGYTITGFDAESTKTINTSFIEGTPNKITFRCSDNISEYLLTVRVIAGDSDTSYTISTSANAGYSITGLDSYTTKTASYNSGTVTFQCADNTNAYSLTIKVKANAPESTEPYDSCGFDFNTIISGNKILYAMWEVQIFLTYNPLGGPDKADQSVWVPYGAASYLHFNDGTLSENQEEPWGWNTNAQGRGAYFKYDGKYAFPYPAAFYAIWEDPGTPPYSQLERYFITFAPNGGSGYLDKQVIPLDVLDKLPGHMVSINDIDQSHFYRDGWVFKEWNTRADGTGNSYNYNERRSIEITDNTTLFAMWEHSVVYNGNGNTGGDVPGNTTTLNTSYNARNNSISFNCADNTNEYLLTIKVRAGSAGTTYTISTSANAGYSITGLVSSTTGSASYNDGTVTFQCADTNEHELTIKVKANVARATCQVSPSSGCTITGFVKPETYADGASVTVAENTRSLEKTGCSFGGWNTKADGTGTKYVPGATFKITENVVLYAIWTPIPNE